ncbi:adenine phosphoribosyltransferase [Acetobacteraceae bacterium]|nr:adenine phosphoribosyltransferase [Acetobacteraceae bacterium]
MTWKAIPIPTSFSFPESVDLRKYIREVPDFPKKGINFYDISTLIANPDAWQLVTARLTKITSALKPDILVGIESRGFICAAPVAQRMGLGFVMIRKPGKLPTETISQSYGLEYGKDELHLQVDAIKPGQRVVIMDDLLATGGTLEAACSLVEQAGGVVAGIVAVIELEALKARQKFKAPVSVLIKY